LINPDVEKCEIFIGLLWKRWGTPSGEFSSSFEEEFSIAMERNRKSGSPQVWLCFKSMDPILEVELGEQLDNVVKFKDDRLRSRDCLFKEFETTTDWELDFFTWLVEYAAGLESESAVRWTGKN